MAIQKITIEPVTRIEGHARITIHLNDGGEVETSFLHVDEFRGLEKFSEGRPYFEMPQITQRICGICPVSHHLASAKSCDAIMGVEPPRPAVLLRELLHMAQFVQSHGMHFFYLAGPDLVLGFDADPAVRNVFGLIEADPQLALKAVGLRRFGQQIIERLGGKRVHPNFAVPGGVSAPLTSQDRNAIAGEIETQIGVALEGVGLLTDWVEKNRDLALRFAAFPSNYMGMVDAAGQLALYDGEIRICDHAGRRLEQFHPRDYLAHVAEHVEPWTYLKFPYLRKIGWKGFIDGQNSGLYHATPLSRLNAADGMATPLAQKEYERMYSTLGGKPVHATLAMHWARLIELLYSAERLLELALDPDITGKELRAPLGPIPGEGVGIVEAQRGTLTHHYWTDDRGIVQKINLIVGTTNNHAPISMSIKKAAGGLIKKGVVVTDGILNMVEMAFRAYDPCFSCATHSLPGKMPLIIEIRNSDGSLRQYLKRDR